MKILFFSLLACSILLIQSCSTEEPDLVEVPMPSETEADSLPTMEEDIPFVRPTSFNLEPDAASFMNGKHSVMENFKSVPFFFVTDRNQYVFIASKEEYSFEKQESYESWGETFETKVYLVDSSGNALTTKGYDRIYNPDIIAYGYCEAKLDGKYGLLNTAEAQEIPAQYNSLYPTNNSNHIAIGKKKNKFYYINKDGSDELITNSAEFPNYESILDSTEVGTNSQDFHPIFVSDNEHDLDELERMQFDYVYFTPSFVEVFEVMPFIFVVNRTDYEIDEMDYDEVAIEMNKVEGFKTQNNSSTFLSSFTETYSEGRGYINENVELSTFDENSRKQSDKLITNDKRYGQEYGCTIFKITQINDSIIEIHKNMDYEEKANFDYAFSSEFEFFIIKEDGEIEKSKMPMLSFIELSPRHLKGCFADWIPEEEQSENSYGGEMWLTDHLSINDIQYMRNELYARKGLIFKSEKWQEIFGAKEWYTPEFEIVDDKITDLEKKNVEFLLSMEKKMEGKEKEFTHPTRFQYVAAG